MGTTEFDGVKGFLPQEEALQLLEWASQGALIGPAFGDWQLLRVIDALAGKSSKSGKNCCLCR
jgi:hypothetical protein